MQKYRLYGRPGWGSAIVEAQLVVLGLPVDLEDVPDLFESDIARAALTPLNPLSQIPTLVLPDGQVMTESAAITLHLADVTGNTEFVPPAGDPARPQFLRWLIFLVANLYPTYTYADEPRRFVADQDAAKAFRAAVDAYQQRLWKVVDEAADSPWFLGGRPTALDIYIAVMTRWRPGRQWFQANAPALHTIACHVDDSEKLRPVWLRNFTDDSAD